MARETHERDTDATPAVWRDFLAIPVRRERNRRHGTKRRSCSPS